MFVVKPDKTVEVRLVKVGFTEANTASIDQGLAAGELVVTDGQDKLQPGSRVDVQPGNAPNRQASGGASQSSGSIHPPLANPAKGGAPSSGS